MFGKRTTYVTKLGQLLEDGYLPHNHLLTRMRPTQLIPIDDLHGVLITCYALNAFVDACKGAGA
jgi:hypothetical protein